MKTTDYDEDPLDQKEHSTELSEDTDCDGSSLPEDSPEVESKSHIGFTNKKFESFISYFIASAILVWQSSRKAEWQEESVDDPRNEKYALLFRTFLMCIFHIYHLNLWCLWINSYLQMSAGQPDEDEITWGSDELPIENLNPNMTDGRSDIWNLLPQM